MPYTPVPSDVTNPLDTVDRSTAAAEFRALKSYLNALTTVAAITTPDIFNNTNHNIDFTGTTLVTGFVAAPVAGAERILICAGAAQFQASANLAIDGTASGATLICGAGAILEVRALTTTTFRLRQLTGAVVVPSTFFVKQFFPTF